ncbi:MAG: hypothetical protein U5L45_03905 [Saprospiraceae bacterium]|nr:hypothetical protein [Saprospiraceae bacterium]
MKKILLYLVCALCVSDTNAQHFNFQSFSVSVNSNSTNVMLGKTDEFTQPQGAKTILKSGLSYGLNTNAAFSMSKKMNLNIGLAFSTFNFKQNITGLKWGVDNDNGAYAPSITTLNSKITTLNLPINGELIINKMQGVTVGIAPSFRLDKKEDLTITRISTNKLLDNFGDEFPVKTLNLVTSISFVQRIKLAEKINLKVESFLGLHLLGDELYLNYTNNRFYQFGLNLGVEFLTLSRRENAKAKRKIGS